MLKEGSKVQPDQLSPLSTMTEHQRRAYYGLVHMSYLIHLNLEECTPLEKWTEYQALAHQLEHARSPRSIGHLSEEMITRAIRVGYQQSRGEFTRKRLVSNDQTEVDHE